MPITYDAIIIGTGQAGPSLAQRLAAAGHEGRDRRAQAVRRHLRQHRLHPDQDDGGERLCRPHGAPRRGFRRAIDGGVTRRHEARQGAEGRHLRRSRATGSRTRCKHLENCTVYQGHARFESPTRSQRGRGPAHRRADLHQRRRPRHRAADARARPDRLPHQQLDDGRRLPAQAPDRRRRQLCRAGVRADVPPLRQRSHHPRDGRRA